MELFIDTTKIEEVSRLSNIYPIKGITTNPLIFAKEFPDDNLNAYYNTLKELAKFNKPLCVQPTGNTIDEMLRQSNTLFEFLPRENIYLKIPANVLGLEVIKRLPNVQILATACMNWEQALIYSQFENVKYAAFYWSGMTDHFIDAAKQLTKGIEITSRTPLKIMAAGFRDWDSAEKAMQLTPHAITIPPALFHEFDRRLENLTTQYYCQRFNMTYREIERKK